MSWSERSALVSSVARFAVVFLLSLMPLPWLPDAYVTVIGRVTNAMVSAVDARLRFEVRYEPPAHIAREGSWKANLRVEDRVSRQSIGLGLDTRSFSYRPMATFVALAAASSVKGARRRLALWLGGLVSMLFATTAFSALPLLSKFAIAGAFGDMPGRLVRTLYQATATPIMVYALPMFVWLFWLLAASGRPTPPAPSETPGAPAADPPAVGS